MRRQAFHTGAKSIFVGIFGLLISFAGISALAGQGMENLPSSDKSAPLPTAVLYKESASILWPGVLSQKDVGDCACGPCAIFNAFQFGDTTLTNLAWTLPGQTPADKVRSLINRFGTKPSAVEYNQPRYLPNGGMWQADLVPFVNDWLRDGDLGPPIIGESPGVKKNETPRQQLQRVYAEVRHSLDAGFPPVVNLESYVSKRNVFYSHWSWLDGHFVTVVGIQNSLPQDASGFSLWAADSESGRVLRVFVCFDGLQISTRVPGGKRSGKWAAERTGGSPFLMVRSPKLERILEGNADRENERVICVLQYIARR